MNEYLGNIKLTRCKNKECSSNHVYFVVTARRTSMEKFSYSYYGYFGGKRFLHLRNCIDDIRDGNISETVKKKLRRKIKKMVPSNPCHSTYQTWIKFDLGQLSTEQLIEFVNKK